MMDCGSEGASRLRSLTLLNERGDTTLVWTEDKDEAMRELIERKMADGVQFFLIQPGPDPLSPQQIEVEMANLDEAMRSRLVLMKDRDFATVVLEGLASLGRMITDLRHRVEVRATTSAQEVISHGRAAATPRFHGG